MSTWQSGGGRPATPEEVDEAQRLEIIERDQLPSVRKAAANWRNSVGIGGVVGFVLASALDADLIRALPDSAKFNGVWLLGIGAALAVASLVLAMIASFGWPRYARLGTTGALDAWERRATRSAVRLLVTSMLLAAIALIVLACALGVLMFQIPFFIQFPGWDVGQTAS